MTNRLKGEAKAAPSSPPKANTARPRLSKSTAKSTPTSSPKPKPKPKPKPTSSPKPLPLPLPKKKLVREAPRLRASAPLQIDPSAPDVDGHAFVRAEQCIALLQRRLIKPMSRGGPRGDLTLTQYHALSFLAARGQASVSELKDILGFAQSTTSVLVDKLSKMGLVEKLRDARDHRLACVVPLPKGLRMVQRYRKNAERNLLALRSVLGEDAVRDVFIALEQALVATAPLEDPRVARVAADDDEVLDEDDDPTAPQSKSADYPETWRDDRPVDPILQAAE